MIKLSEDLFFVYLFHSLHITSGGKVFEMIEEAFRVCCCEFTSSLNRHRRMTNEFFEFRFGRKKKSRTNYIDERYRTREKNFPPTSWTDFFSFPSPHHFDLGIRNKSCRIFNGSVCVVALEELVLRREGFRFLGAHNYQDQTQRAYIFKRGVMSKSESCKCVAWLW